MSRQVVDDSQSFENQVPVFQTNFVTGACGTDQGDLESRELLLLGYGDSRQPAFSGYSGNIRECPQIGCEVAVLRLSRTRPFESATTPVHQVQTERIAPRNTQHQIRCFVEILLQQDHRRGPPAYRFALRPDMKSDMRIREDEPVHDVMIEELDRSSYLVAREHQIY
ncbi:hypothetical protein [Rhodococcus sp. (in: high G+C Gram-positive bacteria)]|uniref:hypothetical protein n=1 Tax=Rhodococcus sp. TaxID=1831 RepID=UPI003BB4CD25